MIELNKFIENVLKDYFKTNKKLDINPEIDYIDYESIYNEINNKIFPFIKENYVIEDILILFINYSKKDQDFKRLINECIFISNTIEDVVKKVYYEILLNFLDNHEKYEEIFENKFN